MRTRSPVRPTLLLVAGALVLVACGATPPVTSPGSPGSPAPIGSASPAPLDRIPVQNQVERDGVTLQIRLDVTATNTQNGLVMWQGGGCDLLGNIQLHGPDVPLAPIGDPPPGNDPAAIRGLVRWSALANSGGGLTGFVPPNLPPGQGFACTSDLRINELKPGATERVEAIWNGTTADGIPSPAGGYTVDVSFPYLSRQDAGPFEGDPFADAEPIVVGVPFEVVGEAWHGLTAAQAVDRALGDGRLITWLAEVDKTELGGASIRLQDGAAWRLEVTLSSPTGIAAVGRVDVDPVTGEVTRVDLPAS